MKWRRRSTLSSPPSRRPRSSWCGSLKKQGLSLTGPDGLLKQLTKTVLGVRYEFGAVVEAHIVRCPVPEGQTIQHIDDAVGIDGAIDFDRECFAGELVDHVQHLDTAAIGGRVELKVHRPDDIRRNR